MSLPRRHTGRCPLSRGTECRRLTAMGHPVAGSVLIIGQGEIGQAIRHLLEPHTHLRAWQRGAPDAAATLAPWASEVDIIFFCVPTPAHEELAARIHTSLRPDAVCVTVAKGLDNQGRTALQTLADALRNQPCAGLYGPMIAEEIRANRPAFAAIGARNAADGARITALFAPCALVLRPTGDVDGISWCAVLKNVYAMLFGVADELALGDNMRGYLAVAALSELASIVTSLGGTPESAYRLAGMGDLITTATSKDSHHHELGRALARADAVPMTGEGPHTLAMIRKLRLFEWTRYPLLTLIALILDAPHEARTIMNAHLAQAKNISG